MALELQQPDIGEGSLSINRTLEIIHADLRAALPGIVRIAFALYDPATDRLKTFVHSSDERNPLPHYETKLSEVPSLAGLAAEHKVRVVNDIPADGRSVHAHSIGEAGYRSSFTKPVFDQGHLFGFLFLDAAEPDFFTPATIRTLHVFIHLAILALIVAISSVKVLVSAVELASGLSRFRDQETGAHMERMSRYARQIARGLASRWNLDEEFVEFLFMFAPLHDVGKIAVPDAVLLKPGSLTAEELGIMHTHVTKGAEIIERMATAFGLNEWQHVSMLRNIVLYHHEAFDGSGYASGLVGDQIPPEARIVTVADIYDALTSVRPYKAAWEPDRAFRFLEEQAGHKVDPDCVQALLNCRTEIEAIAARFATMPENALREGYFDWM